MDQTVNYGFSYPECEEPLVADSSDIQQLQVLAEQVDLVVQGQYDLASSLLVHPDCVRMTSSTVVVPGSTQSQTVSYDQMTFDNTPGQLMSDTANGVVLIQETGWYFVGHHMVASVNGANNAPIIETRFVVNGVGVTGWSPRSNLANISATTIRTAHYSQVIRFNAGDTITSEAWSFQVPINGNWNLSSFIYVGQILGA